MPVARPTEQHMEGVLAGMRETIRARAASTPDPVNLDAAASLFEPIPMLWGGERYAVRNISYREGLKLQKLTIGFEKVQKEPQSTEASVEAHEALLEEILALFWSFLDPKPRTNPFGDATPLEVGAISGFFFACQRIQNQPSRMPAVRLSPSIS